MSPWGTFTSLIQDDWLTTRLLETVSSDETAWPQRTLLVL